MDSKVLFTKTPPTKLFFLAAVPGSIGMLASALYQLIDGILVGQILGDTPFAALNFAMPLVIINFALADLVGVGSAVPISIRLGEKNEKEACNLFTCACLLIVGTGILSGSILFFAAPFLIGMMGAEGDLAQMSATYLRVYALCSPLTTIIFAVDNYLRICGQIRTSMILNIFMSVLSGALEFIFLFVFRWEIWAAAFATCLGMMISALLAFYPFFRGKLTLKFTRPRFHLDLIKRIVFCGSPNFLNNIAGRVTSILMNVILLRMGGPAAVSVYGILMYADGFIQPLLYGMCDSLQPAVGYNWGAGNRKRVNAIEKRCYGASALLSLSLAAALFFAPGTIAGLFIESADSGLYEMALPALRLFAMTYITRWLSFATQSFMSAVERPIFAAAISLSVAFVFPLLVIVILWPMGLTGLWLNFPCSALLAGALSVWILLRFRKAGSK